MSGSVTRDFMLFNRITELMRSKWRVLLRHSAGM